MEAMLQDIRFGIRVLIRRPGFTLVAALALALGIGANTAIFSVVNALLLSPLPFSDPDRLVMVWEKNIPRNRERNVASPANFIDWNDQNQAFEQMAAIADFRANLTEIGEPEEIQAQVVTASFFPLLGVQPLVGRPLLDADDRPDAERVVVLSHRLWQRKFGADPAVVGNAVKVSGRDYTVVGVMPAGFYFLNNDTELWLPMALNPSVNYRRVSGRYLRVVGRLRPDVTRERAQVEMETIASRLEQTHQDFNAGWSVNLVPLHEQVVGDTRPALILLLGSVVFVLLIACANVANLLLARAAARERELAIRNALGAGRIRLIRQLLTESVILAVAGGGLGLLLAYWGTNMLIALSPGDIPRLDEVRLDSRVLGFTLTVSIMTGIIFGLAPALVSSHTNLNETLKEGGRGSSAGPGSRRYRNAFVVSQIALALVLLVSAGLMIKSFIRLQGVSTGFRVDGMLTMRVLIPSAKYREEHQRAAFFQQALERIEQLPDVRSASAINFLPLAGARSATGFRIEGRPEPPPGEDPITDVRVIDSDYFTTMGIPLVRGRLFTERDAADSRVLIISQALARRYWPDEDPIGKRMTVSWGPDSQPDEIIGVVGDIKDVSLESEHLPTIYWPHPREPYSFMTLVVRSAGNPLSLAGPIQSAIRGIDPDQPVSDIRTMGQVLAESIARSRFNTLLLAIFAGVALILAAVGIYGVMAYTVTLRTHEIGIRMALGAGRGEILRLVVGQGARLTVIGLGAGLIAAFVASRLLSGLMSELLFEVSPADPAIFAIISTVLAAVAIVASYLPAVRATRVDPIIALRYE